ESPGRTGRAAGSAGACHARQAAPVTGLDRHRLGRPVARGAVPRAAALRAGQPRLAAGLSPADPGVPARPAAPAPAQPFGVLAAGDARGPPAAVGVALARRRAVGRTPPWRAAGRPALPPARATPAGARRDGDRHLRRLPR